MFSFKLAQKINQPSQAEYDYIIVGAGACGCVVAAKILEQCPGATVAIIEAGGYHEANYGAYIQNMAGYGTQNDYQDQIVDRLFGEDHPGVYHRGLGLGGSTITNGAVWVDTRADIRKLDQHDIVRYTPAFSEENCEAFVAKAYMVDPHFIATCRIGDVVRENFHVHGCSNLMVADASVMPEQTSGNCISAAMMIAQIASDVVKKDWQPQISQVNDNNDTVAVPRAKTS